MFHFRAVIRRGKTTETVEFDYGYDATMLVEKEIKRLWPDATLVWSMRVVDADYRERLANDPPTVVWVDEAPVEVPEHLV